jgi:hypothetical protein
MLLTGIVFAISAFATFASGFFFEIAAAFTLVNFLSRKSRATVALFGYLAIDYVLLISPVCSGDVGSLVTFLVNTIIFSCTGAVAVLVATPFSTNHKPESG